MHAATICQCLSKLAVDEVRRGIAIWYTESKNYRDMQVTQRQIIE